MASSAAATASSAAASRTRHYVSAVVEVAQKCQGSEFHQASSARDYTICEVPFESLYLKKGPSAKDNHRAFMKLSMVRLGGIVGIKDGRYGSLTYGSYLEKDKTTMNHIYVPNLLATEKRASATKESVTPVKLPILEEVSPMIEVPVYVLSKKAKRAACSGHKSVMAESMLRLGGIYSDNVKEGVSSIVYGSYGSTHLEY